MLKILKNMRKCVLIAQISFHQIVIIADLLRATVYKPGRLPRFGKRHLLYSRSF